MTTATKNLIKKLEEQKELLDNSRSILSKYDQTDDTETKEQLFSSLKEELKKLQFIERSLKIQHNNNKEQKDYLEAWSQAQVKRYRWGKVNQLIKKDSQERRILMSGYGILDPTPEPAPAPAPAPEEEVGADATGGDTAKEKVEKQLESQKVQEMTPEEKEKKLEEINKENEGDIETIDISTNFEGDEVEKGLKTNTQQAEITNHGETIVPDIPEEIPEPPLITEMEGELAEVPPIPTPEDIQPPTMPQPSTPEDIQPQTQTTPEPPKPEAIPTFEREIPRGTPTQPNITMSIDNKKSIDQLKEEIKALHIVYDSKIPSFKEKAHTKDKDDALESNDISKVRKHHASMMEKIRLYYNTGGLKLGVIIDAQDYINNQFSFNIPTFSPVDDTRPIKKEEGSFEKGGIPRFSRAVNYKQTYIRGGMAHTKKEPIRNRIPAYIPRPTKHHSLPPVEHTTNTRYSYTIDRAKSQIYTGINLKSKKK